MLAMTNLAAADGSIGCWNDKYYWNFWRPITAIREAAATATRRPRPTRPGCRSSTRPFPSPARRWSRPASPTTRPGTPASAERSLHALKAFFGTDKIAFTAVSNKCSPAPCPPRSFDRFSQALKEIIDARVWSGIHFRTADVQGAVLGKKVAHHLRKHYFQPLD